MKISKFNGHGDYQEGITAYGRETSVYLFGLHETGCVDEEGRKEKEYYLFEFPSLMPLREVGDSFIGQYLEYRGFDASSRLSALYGWSNEKRKESLEQVIQEANIYAEGIMPTMSGLDLAKMVKKLEIYKYDKSEAVNSFSLGGRWMWLHLDTRMSLSNSTEKEKAAGREITTLWHEGVCYNLDIDEAQQMLSVLELYALECYNVTARHYANVDKLSTVEEVESYDYKTGYPEKLVF